MRGALRVAEGRRGRERERARETESMPSFTSVNYRQRGGSSSSLSPAAAAGESAPAPGADEEQVGGGLVSGTTRKVAQGLSKSQMVAQGLGAAVMTSKAGFKPLKDVLDNADAIIAGTKVVEKAKKAAKAASKAGKAAKRGKAAKAGSSGLKAIEGPSTSGVVATIGKSGSKAAKSKETLDTVARLSGKLGQTLKNKNLGEIVQGAATTGRALKGAAKELGKRGGKAALAAAVTGGVTAGVGTMANYLLHVASGGEPMSKKEIGMLAADTGLRLAARGLDGRLTKTAAAEEVIRSYNDIIKNKQGGRLIPKTINLHRTLGNLGKLLKRLDKIHRRRHYEVNGEAPLALETGRPFGSGETMMADDGGQMYGGGRRRRPRRHRCKRRRKVGRRKRRGVKRLQNIFG